MRDRESLTTLPGSKLQSGSSEILNWVTAGGALEGLRMELINYVPGYRSEGGTGVGAVICGGALTAEGGIAATRGVSGAGTAVGSATLAGAVVGVVPATLG